MDGAHQMNPEHIYSAQKTIAEARGITVEELKRQVEAQEICTRLTNPGCLLKQVFPSQESP